MTTATTNLAAAEAALLAARDQAARERRASAGEEAGRIRARLTVLKPAYEKLNVTVRVATNRRLDLHYRILNARAQVADWSTPPADLFASAKELGDRRRQAELWRKRLEELTASYSTAADEEGNARRAALAMAAEYGTLQYQFNNYVTIAEGGEPGFPFVGSGLSEGENFLSVPGSLEDYPAVTVPTPGMRRILADGTEPRDERGVWERL
jgi:hypothetical protein